MAMAESNSHPDKRFKSDIVFNLINKKFITLKDDDMKTYAVHLKTVLELFVARMREIDPFFNACYQRIAYVGSYYEGLKVGKPEEFDLNVIINLPVKYENGLSIIIASEKPGYVKIKANGDLLETLRKHVRWNEYKGRLARQLGAEFKGNARKNAQIETKYNQIRNNGSPKRSPANDQAHKIFRKMEKWFELPDMYLNQNKFRQWFESIVHKTISSFAPSNERSMYTVRAQEYGSTTDYRLGHKKSGPALTLVITLPDKSVIDVDLVPALEFAFAPPQPFRSHTKEKRWFAIPKPLSGQKHDNVLWRPSFYIREQEILKGPIKPVIRQMKKLRDTQNFKNIASYYIKILFLWELEKHDNSEDFQRRNPTYLFFHMLQKLQQACSTRKILDFWNPNNNLLSTISDTELLNNSYRLCNIIKSIEKNIATDPYSIAKYILPKAELEMLEAGNGLSNVMASLSLDTNVEPSVQRAQNNESSRPALYDTFWN